MEVTTVYGGDHLEYEDNYANLLAADRLYWPQSIQANFIFEKQAAAPVFVAMHHHVRSSSE